MNNLFWTEMKLRFHMGANELIYYLQHLPLIKRLVKDRWYAAYDGKIILGVISLVVGFFKKIIFSALLLAVYIGLPIMLLMSDDNQIAFPVSDAILYLMLWANCFLGAWMNNTVICLQYDSDEYMLLHVMHVDAKRHFQILTGIRAFSTFLDFFPLAFFIGFGKYLMVSLVITCCRLISEAVQIFGYMHWKGFRKIKTAVNAIAMVAFVVAGAGVLIWKRGFVPFGAYLASPFTLLIIGLPAVLAGIYLLCFGGYRRIAAECILRESLAFKSTEDAASLSLAKNSSVNEADEKHMDLTQKRFEKKKGYAYLTALFFERHYRLIRRRVLIKSIVFAAALLIYGAAALFVPELQGEKGFQLMLNFSPVMVFVFYIASSGKQICNALFYNCDRVLLKYGYYRKPGVVMENFALRIRYIIVADLLPACILALLPVECMLITGQTDRLTVALIVSGMCLCLSVFFSVFHTFAYYVCQPYTEEMKEQSRLFSLLNTSIYLIAYICLQMGNEFENISELYWFNGIVLGVTIGFILISFPVIYLLAPRRFRLR